MKHQVLAGTAGTFALALLVTGCGGSPVAGSAPEANADATAVYDRINSLSGQEREAELTKLAEEEGKLTVYTSNTDMETIIAGFEKEYDIDVALTRGNSETVLQKLLTEGSAGELKVDFVDNNANELNIMADQGFLYDYESEYRDAVRRDGQMDGWTSHYFNAFVVGWNTDKVEATDLPKEIKDFADPKWKGLISLELSDIDWYAAVSTYYLDRGMSEQEVDRMWAGIAANASIEKGHSTMGDMLSAGKLDIALSIYQHTVDGASADNGAPVAWNPDGQHVEPVVVRPNGAGIMSAAEHPAAAMLFMDYVLSEGQQTIADVHRIPTVEGVPSPIDEVETIGVPEEEMTGDRYEYWDDKYRDLVGG